MTQEQAEELIAMLRGLNTAIWSIRDALYINLDAEQKKQLDKWDKERRGLA